MTCAPTKEPSIALLTTLEETLKEMVSEAEKMPDNKRYKDRAARFAGGVSTVYRYGNIRIEMAGRDQVIDSPFIITTFSGTPVLYHFKDAEQKRIEGISVNYRHSKSGTLDSLGIGESDETDVVFVRASALEKIAEIRSAKPEERKERPSKTDSAPREVKTEDRTKTARR